MESDDENNENKLLLYADGFPGIIYSESTDFILKSKGLISIKEIREKLCVNERTLERHFLKELGVTTKQFAKIIQFSSSLTQTTETDYVNLTEIGNDNGFTDQFHFIGSLKNSPEKHQKNSKNNSQLNLIYFDGFILFQQLHAP